MTEESNGKIVLTETVGEAELLDMAEATFRTRSPRILEILLNSVLVPIGYRTDGVLRVAFVYHVLQEFFLAEYWLHDERPLDKLPHSVKAFCEESQRRDG